MAGGLEKITHSKIGEPFASSANGTYKCTDPYSVVANWYYYYAIGNCKAGWELEVVSYVSENTVTHEHSYGGFVNNAFSGCGWIDTRYPLEKLNSNEHSACAGGGSSREFKVEESTFMEKHNGGTVGDGNPVVNKVPCPEYANYRPWSSSNVEKELIRTAPEYAASAPGSNYPALKWRYVTKYASTDSTGKYVMVRDDRIGEGEGNWVFVPRSCLPATLPENAEERLPPPPTVTTGEATNLAYTSATLSGSANPNGVDTHYYIEWGTEASKPYEGFEPKPYPGEDLGSGTGVLNRSITASGLKPNTTYYYRIVASSATGTSEGTLKSFATPAEVPPTVTTSAASEVQQTTATLNGTVNPNGLDTHYYFEYGETTSYGSSTSTIDAGSGFTTEPESAGISKLVPGVTYHDRLVASNSVGTSYGTDHTLTALYEGTSASWATGDPYDNHQWLYPEATGNLLYQVVEPGTGWGSFDLGLHMASGTTASVVRDPTTGHTWVFAQAENGELYEVMEPGTGWGAFDLHLKMAPHTSPSAVLDPTTDHLWVFAQAENGELYEVMEPGTGWGAFDLHLKMAPETSPAVVREPASGHLWVFAQAYTGELYESIEPGTGWGSFDLALKMASKTSPAAALQTGSGHLWVFAQASTGELYEAVEPGTGWGAFDLALKMAEATSPAVVRDAANGHLFVFAQASTGELYEAVEPGTGWGAFDLALKMAAGASPSATRAPATGLVDVFAESVEKELWQAIEPGTGWGAYNLHLKMP